MFFEHHTIPINRFWIKAAVFCFLLFTVGTLVSSSLVEISKYLSFLFSIKFLWILLTIPPPHQSDSKKNINYLNICLLTISIALTVYLLTSIIFLLDKKLLTISSLDRKLLTYILLGQFWPLLIWIIARKRTWFNDREILYLWFFNGLLWWFIISFIFRDIGMNGFFPDPSDVTIAHQLKGILDFSYSFTFPLTVFYLFLKVASGTDVIKKSGPNIFKTWKVVALTSLGVLILAGLPSLFSLSHHWPAWEGIAQSLDISTHVTRLSSFHFALALGNILAQSFFIFFSWTLGHYFIKNHNPTGGKWTSSSILALGLSCFLFIMFITTWAKLLVPLMIVLLMFFLTIVFKKNLRYILAILVGIGILVTILLNTENHLNQFSKDSAKVLQVFEDHFQSEQQNQTLVKKIIDAELVNSASFIYRLQQHLWGWEILIRDPLTGIGPYGYIDYVITHFPQDLLDLPAVIYGVSDEEITREQKQELITYRTNIARIYISPHSDWVMSSSSGGIPGMLFYYGLFAMWITYFLKRYLREKKLIYLGIVFALFSMLASGITESNFKVIHFHLFTLYALSMMGLQLLDLKKASV